MHGMKADAPGCGLSLLCVPGDYAGFPGCGLLRLHSTYRHDLKIYASDEGRVQMTAAAFAKVLPLGTLLPGSKAPQTSVGAPPGTVVFLEAGPANMGGRGFFWGTLHCSSPLPWYWGSSHLFLGRPDGRCAGSPRHPFPSQLLGWNCLPSKQLLNWPALLPGSEGLLAMAGEGSPTVVWGRWPESTVTASQGELLL